VLSNRVVQVAALVAPIVPAVCFHLLTSQRRKNIARIHEARVRREWSEFSSLDTRVRQYDADEFFEDVMRANLDDADRREFVIAFNQIQSL
jgi:hypothetical protein